MSDDERFLTRWSRRKSAARGAAVDAAASSATAQAGAVGPATRIDGSGGAAFASEVSPSSRNDDRGDQAERAAADPLPDLESLRGAASDYRAFMRPEVDGGLRRAALRKLFADPHFRQMDGLDVYIDDYTRADPVPPAMLAALHRMRPSLPPEDDANAAEEHAGSPVREEPIESEADDAGSNDPRPDEQGPRDDAG